MSRERVTLYTALALILALLLGREHAPAPAHAGLSSTQGIVKSVQYGSITIGTGSTSNTATITAVRTDKALLVYLGGTVSGSGTGNTDIALSRVTLTNSTTVTATRGESDANLSTVTTFVVIEFY